MFYKLPGYVKIVIATIIFSFGPLFVRVIPLDAISIFWMLALTGTILMVIKIALQRRFHELLSLKSTHFYTLAGLGVATAINNSLFNLSVKTTTIANAVLTHYLAPVFLVFFGLHLFKERVERISVLALAFSLAGLLFLLYPQNITFQNIHFLGLASGTLSAIFFAFEIVAKKKLSSLYEADIITTWFLALVIILLFPFASFSNIIQMQLTNWLVLFLYVISTVVIGMNLFISGSTDTKAQHIGVLSYLEPLGAIILSSLVLEEVLSVFTAIGGILILSGGYLVVSSANKKTDVLLGAL